MHVLCSNATVPCRLLFAVTLLLASTLRGEGAPAPARGVTCLSPIFPVLFTYKLREPPAPRHPATGSRFCGDGAGVVGKVPSQGRVLQRGIWDAAGLCPFDGQGLYRSLHDLWQSISRPRWPGGTVPNSCPGKARSRLGPCPYGGLSGNGWQPLRGQGVGHMGGQVLHVQRYLVGRNGGGERPVWLGSHLSTEAALQRGQGSRVCKLGRSCQTGGNRARTH